MSTVKLVSDELEATISSFGAELVGLRHARHGELLWSGDAEWWDRQSPLMFPVVGRSIGDHVRINGREYPMPLHGFAHSMEFELVSQKADEVRLRLADSKASAQHYPYAFQLDLTYRLDGPALMIEAHVLNAGDSTMPASFGFHPGFVWPLPGAQDKSGHFIKLDRDDHLDVARAVDGFMLAEETRVDLPGRRLALGDDLFGAGAMVMRRPESRAVTYSADGSPCSIRVEWHGLPTLLFWTRPGAPFVCIEPWAGAPDPAGFGGEMFDRPGVDIIAPGASRSYRLAISIGRP